MEFVHRVHNLAKGTGFGSDFSGKKRRLRCSRPFDLLLFEHTLRILDQQDRQPGDGAQGYGRETQQTVVQYLAEALLKIRRPFAEVFKEKSTSHISPAPQ